MHLSYRLNTVASFVTPGNRLADIGTDHGYVPITLVRNNVIPSAIAMDINKGPLMKAKANIEDAHLEDRIQIRISDGLSSLNENEADTVLIAGMGGMLIKQILAEGAKVLGTVKELVLSPHSHAGEVRKFLQDHGYRLVKETMLEEDGKTYQVLKAKRGNMDYTEEIHFKYGKMLLDSKNPVLYNHLIQQRDKTEQILMHLMENPAKAAKTRVNELNSLLDLIKQALTYYID